MPNRGDTVWPRAHLPPNRLHCHSVIAFSDFTHHPANLIVHRSTTRPSLNLMSLSRAWTTPGADAENSPLLADRGAAPRAIFLARMSSMMICQPGKPLARLSSGAFPSRRAAQANPVGDSEGLHRVVPVRVALFPAGPRRERAFIFSAADYPRGTVLPVLARSRYGSVGADQATAQPVRGPPASRGFKPPRCLVAR